MRKWLFDERILTVVGLAMIIGLAVACSLRMSHRLKQDEANAKEKFRLRCEQVGGIVVPRNVGNFLGGSSYQDDCVVGLK